MLDVLRCLTGSYQLRRATRIVTARSGQLDDFRATFVDLTPYGAGAIVDGAGFAEPLSVGDQVPFTFDLPTTGERVANVSGVAIVRSTRQVVDGYLCGLEFTMVDFASSDALYEYCEVLHAAGSTDDAGGPAVREPMRAAPRLVVMPSRLPVRLSAIAVLVGVCVATAPPFATTSASDGTGLGAVGVDPARLPGLEQVFLMGVFAASTVTIGAVLIGSYRLRVRRAADDR
jgi:hypothetical protein